MSFRHKPKNTALSPEEFINAADHGSAVAQASDRYNTDTGIIPVSVSPSPSMVRLAPKEPEDEPKPWDGLNKKGASNRTFNLKLNDYWWAVLHHVGEQDEDKSLQALIKEILLPELERRAEKTR